MARTGSFSTQDMRKLQQRLNKIKDQDLDLFMEQCAKELAARLLAMVVRRTLPGDYSHEVEVVAKKNSKNHKKGDVYTERVNPSGKKGGTLRRGWTAKTHEEAAAGKGKSSIREVEEYAQSLEINREGNIFTVEIINPVEYASYVEYGHRTRNHKGWVRGKFMLTTSERELKTIAPKVLEKKIKKFLKECIQ